ncbi:Nudix hydrolase 2 [Glycine soja]|uniref:Nudix hydrolase domain-containing protein n=1 Tax=Glycine max TaxID=3847 RepID=K7MJA5_SOYBN|nr:hypothetical protein JHK86_046111 [Glycine max]
MLFEYLLNRQSHMSFFEKSDLLFVCLLRPLSFSIQIQEVEIEVANWMPFDEYAAQTFMEKFELLKYTNDIYLAKIDGQYFGFTPVSITSNFFENKNYLYLNVGGLKMCKSL